MTLTAEGWEPPEDLALWLYNAEWGYLYECGQVHFSDRLHAHGRVVALIELSERQEADWIVECRRIAGVEA